MLTKKPINIQKKAVDSEEENDESQSFALQGWKMERPCKVFVGFFWLHVFEATVILRWSFSISCHQYCLWKKKELLQGQPCLEPLRQPRQKMSCEGGKKDIQE